MRIVWHNKAEEQKDHIADYVFEYFGYDRMKQFLNEVEQTTQLINEYPNLGAIDSLFSNRQEEYRSVVIDELSKMVYLINEDTIHIVAFWDCRQEPEHQATETKLHNK